MESQHRLNLIENEAILFGIIQFLEQKMDYRTVCKSFNLSVMKFKDRPV
jgi:hypothetical protein